MFQLNKFVKVVLAPLRSPNANETQCICHRNRTHNTNNFYGTLCMFIAFIFPFLFLCTHPTEIFTIFYFLSFVVCYRKDRKLRWVLCEIAEVDEKLIGTFSYEIVSEMECWNKWILSSRFKSKCLSRAHPQMTPEFYGWRRSRWQPSS